MADLKKRVVAVGKYVDHGPEGKPFYVEVQWSAGHTVRQPCTENEMLALVNHIIEMSRPVVAMKLTP